MAAKIIEYHKEGSHLASVSLRPDKSELGMVKSFLADEPGMKVCPHCGAEEPEPNVENISITISNPLMRGLMRMALPTISCKSCGNKIQLSMMDYTPFTSIVEFIERLIKNSRGEAGDKK